MKKIAIITSIIIGALSISAYSTAETSESKTDVTTEQVDKKPEVLEFCNDNNNCQRSDRSSAEQFHAEENTDYHRRHDVNGHNAHNGERSHESRGHHNSDRQKGHNTNRHNDGSGMHLFGTHG